MTWVLLVVITFSVQRSESVAATSVPGFTSEAACREAGYAAQRGIERGVELMVRVACLPQLPPPRKPTP